MLGKPNRFSHWLTLIASGAVLLQATGCEFTMQALQTGFLGAITAGIFYLARSV